MPFEIDIHENTFLEGIWQQGRQETLLKICRSTLEQKFGPLPPWVRERVDQADSATLETWISRVISSQSLPEVFQ